ncbi:hypothetical protein K1T71_002470 [Dendrolimus kikuchii]|uniref:Uncharacterized protein n=1 Tax=Dendrolimus kikuchii TaxID=765133 RepID=A0ACC1DCT0_9NEOP|nr:hypothetical protein K1T71_002470 [Dendrolimus kikuchii]
MVTSNKLLHKKVVKMSEHNNSAVIPQRTLLGEVNEHITCPLCRGYYIDATTIVECLHSFCRSCIIKHLKVKSYCPVCEMMINSAKPNIKLDKALQDIVYKLVPGLFQKEMERRQQFYASRPGPAASATPEQRGEDTERVIFSPEDVISFSLEYSDATDTDSISSKSSDSNEPQPSPGLTRRYLQCPAVVNISHLKKFLSMKFDIDSTQFAIDILYKRVPLPDYYTLMDIAYIYNWKRNEPMRFFYQIIDYIAIRNRLFDINRKNLHFSDRKSSPASTEDTSISSPAINLNDQASEASSGTDSPMLSESQNKQVTDNGHDKLPHQNKNSNLSESNVQSLSKSDEDVEKSQFLNSFELTAKSNCLPLKTSPSKSSTNVEDVTSESTKNQISNTKLEDKYLKRKNQSPPVTPELKKLKIELEKAKISNYICSNLPAAGLPSSTNNTSKVDTDVKHKEQEEVPRGPHIAQSQTQPNASSTHSNQGKEVKPQQVSTIKQQVDTSALKRTAPPLQNNLSPKRKPNEIVQSLPPPSISQKLMPSQKPVVSKFDISSSLASAEAQKPITKKIPDLKPSVHMAQSTQHKTPPPVNKLRMDLLANNSDPTIDRSKILPQVKCSLGVPNPGQTSGNPLKSLFDSCKLNIPSSLSITLTDQKLDSRSLNEPISNESKKNVINKNLGTAAGNSNHKAPSPPVHNYIEILKLPDTDCKKPNKSEVNQESKSNSQNKTDTFTSQTKSNKPTETSAKGPIPNLKPISDTKLCKQTGNFSSPITFQQTFEQQVQSMQSDKKTKPKNKSQVPKLVPANPKSMSNVNKPNNPLSKPNTSNNTSPTENKTSTALDLSTAHNVQSQLSSQQTFDKTLETMQSIANLAKKQSLPSKGLPLNMTQSAVSANLSRSLPTGVSPLRIPTTSGLGQIKLDKPSLNTSQLQGNRQDLPKSNQIKPINSGSPTMSSSSYNIPPHVSPNPTQPIPRSQTRSPSSSPKLVIAEEKQASASTSDHTINQSNHISSTQLSSANMPKSESPKASPGPSKINSKHISKPLQPGKVSGIWQPLPPNLKSNPLINNPADFFSRQYLPKPMDINNANNWFRAQRQFELLKSMSNMAHQTPNDFTNKEK